VSAWGWLAVAALGALATLARFVADIVVRERTGGTLPLGTIAVNLSGALALGLLSGLAVRGELLTLLGSAALGSYTTFSTWLLESDRLAREHRWVAAALNVLGCLLLGVGAVALGRLVGAAL
jgi:CrcB protein